MSPDMPKETPDLPKMSPDKNVDMIGMKQVTPRAAEFDATGRTDNQDNDNATVVDVMSRAAWHIRFRRARYKTVHRTV